MSDLLLRAAAKFALDRRRTSLWRPQDGAQKAFVEAQEPDVCFGGARGGGKTLGLLLSFLRHANQYGRHARGIIFRRTFTPELEEVIRKGQDVFGESGWAYNGSKHEFTGPSGATLVCRYLENDVDATRYQGHEYTWMAFDELQNWPEPKAVDLLWGSLRSTAGVPCVRRSTCNPGGPGHAWVRERYDPDHPGRNLLITPLAERPDLTIPARFIPSRLEDNPKLLESDPTYEARLAAAGSSALFQAWRYGRWDITAGQFFDLWDADAMTVEPAALRIEPWHTRWISGDWGFADDCVIHWHAIDDDKKVTTYRELKFNRTTPDAVAGKIGEANRGEKISSFPFSPDAFAQRTSTRTIALEMAEVLRGYGMPAPMRADNDRIGGWMLMYQMLASGHWRISRACPELVKALPLLQRKSSDMEDVDDSPVDHAPDSARYGLKTYMRSRPGVDDRIERFVQERLSSGEPLLTPPAAAPPIIGLEDEDGRAGMVIRPTREPMGATDYNRIAMLTRMAEAKLGRPRLRAKAKGYGKSGWR